MGCLKTKSYVFILRSLLVYKCTPFNSTDFFKLLLGFIFHQILSKAFTTLIHKTMLELNTPLTRPVIAGCSQHYIPSVSLRLSVGAAKRLNTRCVLQMPGYSVLFRFGDECHLCSNF